MFSLAAIAAAITAISSASSDTGCSTTGTEAFDSVAVSLFSSDFLFLPKESMIDGINLNNEIIAEMKIKTTKYCSHSHYCI